MNLINEISTTLPSKPISTCQTNEAFRLADSWYTKISIYDEHIRNSMYIEDSEFVEEHTIFGHEGTDPKLLIPCIHLGSSGFCYLSGNRNAEEWATLNAVLTAHA